MKNKATTVAIFALVLVAGFAVMNASAKMGLAAVSAAQESGNLHITKTCPDYFAAVAVGKSAGAFCTITVSNVAEIPVGSRVYYDQAIGTPSGFLDSNVLLNAGAAAQPYQHGNWAVGRCTLDLATGSGLCTFSNGVGALAGFRARIDVTPAGGFDFNWDGRYNFGGQ